MHAVRFFYGIGRVKPTFSATHLQTSVPVRRVHGFFATGAPSFDNNKAMAGS
jgi:hypothetical protein